MLLGQISRFAFVAALAGAATAPAFADEADDAIVITGQSLEETLPQELSRYGNDLTVIEERQIKEQGALDVARALEAVPGLYIRSRNGPFSYVDVALQGSRTQDVLWTMDGIRLNNRLYGGTSPNDTLPASMIERIEVLKGGESLFYGTQASAGIINVVTRGFTNDFNGQINASVDNYATTSLDGYVRGALGDHRFVAYASHNQAEGYRTFSTSQPSLTDKHYGYDVWSVGLKYQYELVPDLVLNAQYQHTKADLDNLSVTRIRESRNDRNEEIASVRLDYTGNDTVQFFLKGYFHDWKTAYVQIRNPVPAGPPEVVYPAGTFWGYQDYGASAVMKLHLHPGLEYLVGYDFQSFNGRDDVLLISNLDEKVHAGVFQLRTTDELSRDGHFAAGLRYNKTGSAEKTIWNASGRYAFSPALYVEANGGTSFLLPDASQLYGADPCCELGNPNLKPEESLNLNVSLGGTIPLGAGALRWKGTYFNRRINNLIDYDYPDDPAYPNGTYINVDQQVKAQGAELGFGLSFPSGWAFDASYTWSRVRNHGATLQRDRNPEQFARNTLAYRPHDKPFGASLSVSWVGDVYATPAGFSRRNYGNYALVDLASYFYLDQARTHRLGVTVENLFDKEYATRGWQSAITDAGSLDGSNSRFLYYARGVPLTARISYGISF
ncbi:MAG TPA: TonB-dependent receptor [Sphingobium sp.]|nr:TonB-dependent receptor [Sphingobium sp.]